MDGHMEMLAAAIVTRLDGVETRFDRVEQRLGWSKRRTNLPEKGNRQNRAAARMNENRLPDYLDHIKRAGADACVFVDGLSREDFLGDRRTQQAVMMSLVIIGEAATKIRERHAEFAVRHPEVPWRSLRGIRDRIAQGYFEIDLDMVWETVQTALPEMLQKLPVTGFGRR